MIRVCPFPYKWDEIYQRLSAAAELRDPPIPPPPIPLLLSGWNFSNDAEKQERWRRTEVWADRYGLSHLLEDGALHEMYCVEWLQTDPIGPGGGPMKLPWSFEPKKKVEPTERIALLSRLKEQWPEVAGVTLAAKSAPSKITGLKGRRLVVEVAADAVSPWGSWHQLPHDSRRREFTALRARLNTASAPNEFDHVDFVVAREQTGVGP